MLPPRSPTSQQDSEPEAPNWDKYKPQDITKKQGLYVYRE